MVYTAPTEVAFRSKSGSLSKKLCTELALIQAEVLTAEISDVGTTSTTFTVDSDSVLGKIAITAVAGAANKTLTLSNAALTDNRTLTFPDATDTVVTLAAAQALSSKSLNMNAAALLTGTGTPVLKFGDIDTAVSYLLTASFIPMQVNVSGGGTGIGTLGAGYFRTATGIAQTGQLATLMVRTALAHNVLDAYGMQSHMSVTASMGTTNANAHLTAISGKITLTNTPTVATGWVNAGLFIIEGAGAVTQMCHVISAVCEAGVTACDSIYHAYSDSTVNAAFQFDGTGQMTHLFDFDAVAGCVSATDIHIDIASAAGYIPYASSAAQFVTLTGAQALTNKTQIDVTSWSSTYTNSALNVGKYGAPLVDATSTDNILVSFNSSTGTNKGGADRSSMVLFVGNATTGAVTNNKMQGVLSSMTVGHNVFDAYAGQFHINVSATMATQAGTANLVGLAAKASIKNGATATGYVSSLYILGGDTDSGSLTGTATSGFDLVRMENAQVGCNSAIKFIGDANIAYLFDMDVAGCVSTSSGAVPNATHKIKVNMGGVTGYIHVGAS